MQIIEYRGFDYVCINRKPKDNEYVMKHLLNAATDIYWISNVTYSDINLYQEGFLYIITATNNPDFIRDLPNF